MADGNIPDRAGVYSRLCKGPKLARGELKCKISCAHMRWMSRRRALLLWVPRKEGDGAANARFCDVAVHSGSGERVFAPLKPYSIR